MSWCSTHKTCHRLLVDTEPQGNDHLRTFSNHVHDHARTPIMGRL